MSYFFCNFLDKLRDTNFYAEQKATKKSVCAYKKKKYFLKEYKNSKKTDYANKNLWRAVSLKAQF